MEVLLKKENNTSHENTDILCDPCEGNNETKTAENYCVDCNEFLCNNCAKVHRKSRMSLHHKVLEGDEMPRQKLVLSDDDVCSRHDRKPLEYFCNNHAGFYCASCVTLDHRNCKLEYLTEKAEGFEDSEDYRTLINRIQRVSQLITGTKNKIGQCEGGAKSNHTKFLIEIQEFRNNIETILQATEDAAKEKAKLIQTRDQHVFDTLSQRSDKLHGEVDAIVEGLDGLKACRQQSRLCIAAKKFETKIKTFETELEEMSAKTKVSRYSFRGSEIMKRNIGSWVGLELLKFADDLTSTDKLSDDEPDKGSDFEEKKANNISSSFPIAFNASLQEPLQTNNKGIGKVKPFDSSTNFNQRSGLKIKENTHINPWSNQLRKPLGKTASPQMAQMAMPGFISPQKLLSNNFNQTEIGQFHPQVCGQTVTNEATRQQVRMSNNKIANLQRSPSSRGWQTGDT